MLRGADNNPANRFEKLRVEVDQDAHIDPDQPPPLPRTQFVRDHSQSILGHNSAGDLSFQWSLNPYRGCEHGCAYCYARPYHEYLGYSAGLDFESTIVVKEDAPALLAKELGKRGYQVGKVALSGVTDCYQPAERHFRVTRGCLEVLAACRHPVVMITKNFLITRDIDLLAELARHQAVAVYLSITSLDTDLAGELEPRASRPRARLEAIRRLRAAGIPAGVAVAPVIPGLNDHEIPAILTAAKEADAAFATWSMVRLPGPVAEVFSTWLDRCHPLKKEKILARIRDAHGGRLNDNEPGRRMRGHGTMAGQIRAIFETTCRRLGLPTTTPDVSAAAFRPPPGPQLELFD